MDLSQVPAIWQESPLSDVNEMLGLLGSISSLITDAPSGNVSFVLRTEGRVGKTEGKKAGVDEGRDKGRDEGFLYTK